jgi:hypothetical protein
MRASRLAIAALALVVAAALLVLAADLSRWRQTMQADDLQYAAGTGTPDWRGRDIVPFGVARRLLAVDDDRVLRRAVLGYRTLRDRAGGRALDPSVTRRARGEVESALAAVAESGSGAGAAQADDLLGILAFSDSTSGGAGAAPVERSVSAFEDAIRLDRDNTAAKYNLELVLRLLTAKGERPGSGPAPGTRGTGRRGAGGGTPGRGY